MDTTQILLTATLTVTTIFLIVVGVQLIFVLRELLRALKKVNSIVDGFEKLAEGVEHSFSEVLGFFAGLKSLMKILDVIHKKKKEK